MSFNLLMCWLVSAWVDAVWDFEFTHTDPLDPVIEEEIKENTDVFKTVYMQLLPFSIDDDEDDDNTQVYMLWWYHFNIHILTNCHFITHFYIVLQSVWVVFGENGVFTKALVAVLSYFILSAKGKNPSLEQRLCGLQAASLYLLLLKIPGQFSNPASGPLG